MPSGPIGLEHGPVEEDESLAVVVIILAVAAVETVSIEVAGLIDQVDLDARARQRALENASLDFLRADGDLERDSRVAEIGTPQARRSDMRAGKRQRYGLRARSRGAARR